MQAHCHCHKEKGKMSEKRIKERRSGIDRRSNNLETEVSELRNIIFSMLNFTNMYALVLDQQMVVRFVNTSLALDLGYKSYNDVIGQCWLDFIPEKDRKIIGAIHTAVSLAEGNWNKYREFKNQILNKNGDIFHVHWFNSHINTNLNWTFSFGVRERPIIKDDVDIDSVRDYYRDIINKDREMIFALRDVIGLRDKIVDTCRPNFNQEDTIYL
jgi:PAS domain S-box-containing protein